MLRPPEVGLLVAAYFDTAGRFAGETFDSLGRNDDDSIGTDDLLACTLLDIRFPPLAVRGLLDLDRERVSGLLSKVPSDLDLWDANDADLAAAKDTWKFFRSYRGVDWVIAGKLLARKRPRLIPVIDSVVTKALRFPSGTYWATFRESLADEGRRRRIEALRPKGLTTPVSQLRLLDVAIWMQFSESTNARNARLKLGLQVSPRR